MQLILAVNVIDHAIKSRLFVAIDPATTRYVRRIPRPPFMLQGAARPLYQRPPPPCVLLGAVPPTSVTPRTNPRPLLLCYRDQDTFTMSSTVSLKIFIPEQNATKGIQFDKSTSVFDSCRLIRDKITDVKLGQGMR